MVVCCQFVYPIWFGSPALKFDGVRHFGVVQNDISLSIAEVQAVSRMRFPWSSSNFYSFPESHFLWGLESLSTSTVLGYQWLVSRIFQPTFVVNSYALLGIVLTGILTFILCRRLGISVPLSCSAGILSQLLPIQRQMLLSGAAATWNMVFPLLLSIVLSSNNIKRSTASKAAWGLLAVLASFLNSIYGGYFCLTILFIWIAIHKRSFISQVRSLTCFQRRSALFICVVMIFASYLFIQALLRQTTNEYGTQYGSYSTSEVLKDSYSILGYVRPDFFHLLFPSSNWEPEGYSQQYGGLLIFLLGLSGLFACLRARREHLGPFLIAISTLTFIVFSLGRIHIGSVEIPSLREFLRLVMIGNRRFAIAGVIAQGFLVVLAFYFLESLRSRIRGIWILKLLMIVFVLVSVVDLNPLSRRFFNDYAEQYSSIRVALNASPDSAIYVSPGTEREKNYYVLDYPTFRNNVLAFAHAAQGPEQLAAFLKYNRVDYLLALVNENGNSYIRGYIQNSVRFTTILPPEFFTPVAPDVLLKNTADDRTVERERKVRLVKVTSPGVLPSATNVRLAQFVSQPIMEVAEPDVDRSDVTTEWSTNREIELRTEALPSEVNYKEPPFVDVVLSLVAPPNTTDPLDVSVRSSFGVTTVTINQDPVTVRVKSRLYESILVSTDSECRSTSAPVLGVLNGRGICFGVTDFAILQYSK